KRKEKISEEEKKELVKTIENRSTREAKELLIPIT
ncbi:MAG: hypothetical protein HW410_1902, partial [Nitrosarchaeum sp.]|nr:hypothetical protein [Nitrosarchaeum sp.]